MKRAVGLRHFVIAALAAQIWGAAGAAEPEPVASFELAGIEIGVVGELGSFELAVDTTSLEDNLELATLRLHSATPEEPPSLTLTWSMPSHDVHGQWNSGAGFDKTVGPDWYPSRLETTLTRHAPVMALFGANDANRLTFAVSEALNPVQLSVGVREEDARIYGTVRLFTERHRPITDSEIELRFDVRDIPFGDALAEVSEWWASRPGFEPSPVPETARLPMYSTWYSYHQSVSAEELLREVEVGKSLGFEAIIIDDGWQTLDSQRGYAFTGDWKPERIPQMKTFVDGVHQRGMRILLWYSLPLVGEQSAIYAEFEGKYLRAWDDQGASVLDPRYPEVREHIIETYRRAILDWGVDGFKLDFLGFLVAIESTELTLAEGRDFASVNEATDRLMSDIMSELRQVRADIMIEFRQPYIGPLMRKYGNMFRAGDSPNAAVENRVRVVDLRLLSGDTAVHSDMFMWHYDEPVETAALQVLNILFSVPQLSVRLEGIPDDHRDMVAFYTDYWRRNRSVLLDGPFTARSPLANYPVVEAHDESKRIIALYQDVVIDLSAAAPSEQIDIVNAKVGDRVVFAAADDMGSYDYVTYDARGRETARGSVALNAGVHHLVVPASGLLTLERQE